MKKMKLFSIGLCLALAFTACGKSDTTDTTGTTVTLGTYKGVEVSVDPVEVTDEEMQAEIDYLLSTHPSYTAITDRTDVQDGDIVDIDFVGSVDGKEFDGGSAEGNKLTIGSGSFIDDFEEQLIGHNVGETVDVNVTFPEEYKNNPDLAGKDALFVVTINAIVTKDEVELTDEFVKANTDFDTVDAYKDDLYNSLLENEQSSADTQKEINLMTTVIENSTFNNLAQTEIDDAITQMNAYYESMATSYGIDYATFKYYFFGMDEETFSTELAKAADLQVKQKYVLEAIAEAEKLSVTEEEYSSKLAEYAATYQYESPEEFETESGKENIEKTILLDKALQLVKDNAVYTEKTAEEK